MTAAILVTLSCMLLPLIQRFELVAATQAIAAAAGAIFVILIGSLIRRSRNIAAMEEPFITRSGHIGEPPHKKH